jgi:UDP-N-acetylglucosamine 2-epimerase
MDHVLHKTQEMFDIKSRILTNYYYDHHIVNEYKLSKDTISIVMTACNRSKQTYYSLESFARSSFKSIQVIIVDDSDTDPIRIEELTRYPFYINFIKINKSKKDWSNPCVNYNIGFEFVKGNQVVIQNAEVCHVGDVLQYIHTNVDLNSYYVFDVIASYDYTTNETIYNKDKLDISMFHENLWSSWYQKTNINNNKYHFLTAMNINVFKNIGGFSYDYAFGNAYDDNDFVLKITSLDIPIITVDNQIANCGGAHLFHGLSENQWAKALPMNDKLFDLKKNYYQKTSMYIDISENVNTVNQKLSALGLSKKPVIVTITGIRPDFIRMSVIFKELDTNFHHILIHTGQHYDTLLSDVFFDELSIRKPDYILDTGKSSSNHYEQLSYLSTAVPRLLKENNIYPDLILFLGDSNSASVSLPLKKEGYRIGHIEAGMRSYDKRMLEELNRTVCDHCSDILFVYHEDYKQQIAKENILTNVHVVGNTIVEPFMLFKDSIMNCEKRKDMILLDIHRPENFNDLPRLIRIFKFANDCINKYGLPVRMLYFKRLQTIIDTHKLDIGNIEIVPLMPYKTYLTTVYHCRFIISDSGTGQEEPALLNTPVVVPRDFSERPQSYSNNCSVQFKNNADEVFQWITDIEAGTKVMKTDWLGDGQTSKKIIEQLKIFFIALE